jgi:hypothetical protein
VLLAPTTTTRVPGGAVSQSPPSAPTKFEREKVVFFVELVRTHGDTSVVRSHATGGLYEMRGSSLVRLKLFPSTGTGLNVGVAGSTPAAGGCAGACGRRHRSIITPGAREPVDRAPVAVVSITWITVEELRCYCL